MDPTWVRPEKGEEYFFYADRKGGCSLESFALHMREPLDETLLAEALKKAVDCFPLFGMRPVIGQDGYLYLEENPLPHRLYRRNQGVWHLGSEETNGYLFRVICDGTFLSVRAHHSLGDGRTIIAFTMTLVYYYLKLTGMQVEPEGKIYTEADRDDPSLLASFLKDAREVRTGEPHDVYVPQNVFTCPEGRTGEGPAQYRIRWSNREMLDRVHTLQGKMTAFLDAVVALALHDLFEVGEQHIVTGIPVDMRARMKKRSQRNYIGNIRLPYYPAYRELPFEEQVRRLQQDMDVQMEMDNMISRVRKLEQVVDALVEGPLVPAQEASGENDLRGSKAEPGAPGSAGKAEGNTKRAAHGKNMAAQTFLLTNTGRVSLPAQMEDAVDDLIFQAASRGERLAIVVSGFGDQGNLVIGHARWAKELARRICQILNEKGVHAACEPVAEEQEEDRIEIAGFKREEEQAD